MGSGKNRKIWPEPARISVSRLIEKAEENMKPKDRSSGPKLTRGEFLRLAAGAGAALAFGSDAGAAGPQLMRAIPRSGERIPAVGLGTAHTFNVGRDPALVRPRKEVVRLFLREGGRVRARAGVRAAVPRAAAKEARVFSGWVPAAPRWPITTGRGTSK